MDQVIRNLTDGERKAWAEPPNLIPDFIVEYKRQPSMSTDQQARLIRKGHVIRQAMVRARDEILAIWEKAKAEGRETSNEETREVEDLLKAIGNLKASMARVQTARRILERAAK